MDKKNKGQLKGQITVFASLIIVLVLSVVCASIRSAAMSVAKTNANIACNLSVESVFAQYSKPLLDEFDLLLFKKTDQLEFQLRSYIEENIKYSTGFTSEMLQSLKINELIMATDNGGTVIKQEILDYMNYGILSEASKMIIGSEEKVKKSEKTKEIVDKISRCEDYTSQIDSIVLQLITKVEGLDTNDYGFITKHNIPIATQDNFVKMLCLGEPTTNNVSVNNAKVYDVLYSKYINVIDILSYMYLDAESIFEDSQNDDTSNEDISNEDTPNVALKNETVESDINSYESTFLRNYNELYNLISSVIEKTQEAIAIAESYQGALDKVTNLVDNTKLDVETNRSIIGEELANGFGEDLSKLGDFDNAQSQSICDVNQILNALKSNQINLNNTKQIFNSINKALTKENAQHAMTAINQCEDAISKFDNSKLEFDYSGVDFSSGAAGLGTIENIIRTMKDGMLGLVIDDPSKISSKTININDLASSQQNGTSNYWSNISEGAKDNVLYNEYLFGKFNSYSDSFDSKGELIETDDLLNYKLEYILGGKDSDIENLKSTILQLSLIREGTNLEYLFTDSEKKYESYTLALSLLGFTGNYAVIKAGQYLIMSAWAYGEAIIDMRKLFSGEKVEIEKNKSNWTLSLERLLAMNFTADNSITDNDKGYNYEEYLRILLYMENPNDKYYRTMDTIEIKMIEKGNKNFRLKNYVYSLNATAVFLINGKSNYYNQTMQYAY